MSLSYAGLLFAQYNSERLSTREYPSNQNPRQTIRSTSESSSGRENLSEDDLSYTHKKSNSPKKQKKEEEPDKIIESQNYLCNICMNGYQTTEGRIPIVLTCGHTVCLVCAKEISKHTEFKCPFDKNQFPRGSLKNMPKNFALIELINEELQSKPVGINEYKLVSAKLREIRLYDIMNPVFSIEKQAEVLAIKTRELRNKNSISKFLAKEMLERCTLNNWKRDERKQYQLMIDINTKSIEKIELELVLLRSIIKNQVDSIKQVVE
ncbi:hypothetical protein FGO68_gene15381 [Halteria grandinella]|uniref:RING-type domain-containing protein n=1 Tax=Halteria grandinella TaxID=5974 RepID=A0A8J8T051_HALGN|nr:hypothetical protein FGO68_gene15381 [Halteria grandinella]